MREVGVDCDQLTFSVKIASKGFKCLLFLMEAPCIHGLEDEFGRRVRWKSLCEGAQNGVRVFPAVRRSIVEIEENHEVGLADADVYGPSVPKMTGTEGVLPEIEVYKPENGEITEY